MKQFLVEIYINREKWGTYEIFATDADTVAFFAGMKYASEEQRLSPGTFLTANASLQSPWYSQEI